jgi:hypothetical protein
MTKGYHRFTAEELAWIEANSTPPRKALAAEFACRFDRGEVTNDQIHSLCKRKGWLTGRTGQFRVGERRSDHPARKGVCAPGCEKGWFKKGHRNGTAQKRHQPIGAERITRDGYVSRKVNDDMPLHKRWLCVHIINWVAVNGPVPEGHRLKSLDGDKRNCIAENWIAIPMLMAPLLNGKHGRDYDTAPAEVKPTIMAVARLHDRINKVRGGTGRAESPAISAIR